MDRATEPLIRVLPPCGRISSTRGLGEVIRDVVIRLSDRFPTAPYVPCTVLDSTGDDLLRRIQPLGWGNAAARRVKRRCPGPVSAIAARLGRLDDAAGAGARGAVRVTLGEGETSSSSDSLRATLGGWASLWLRDETVDGLAIGSLFTIYSDLASASGRATAGRRRPQVRRSGPCRHQLHT